MNSNRTVVYVSTMRYIFDIRQWIEPFLEEIHKHTTPHIFLFRRNPRGKAEMFYKHWSNEEWSPSEGLILLKVEPCCCFSNMIIYTVLTYTHLRVWRDTWKQACSFQTSSSVKKNRNFETWIHVFSMICFFILCPTGCTLWCSKLRPSQA